MLIVVFVNYPPLLRKCFEGTLLDSNCFLMQFSLIVFPFFIFDMFDSLFVHSLKIQYPISLLELHFDNLVDEGRFGIQSILSAWQQLIDIKMHSLDFHFDNWCNIGSLMIVWQSIIISSYI